MLFHSTQFLVFYLAVFAVYWLLPWRGPRKLVLLAASYYFYMAWDPWLALLIAGSTLWDYVCGAVIDASEAPRVRRAALVLSIVGNLGLLGVFKYANFFVDSALGLAHALGYEASRPELEIILPVGISFYTFQTMSYTIDIYRRELKPCRSALDFALYVAFFPQLVAGPIVRAATFLPQLDRDHRWDWWRGVDGAWLVALGLFKKVVLADNLAIVADAIFAAPGQYGAAASWLGTIAFAFQIYADFSAYSDIACGVAGWLGYEFPENFHQPYLARGMQDFWRRWHISLSTWLRDYLYIPLGGSRHGTWITYRNLLLTMLLGGLWHGAAWTFVAWGAYHGLLLAAERWWLERVAPRLGARVGASSLAAVFQVALTFVAVCLGWVLFRARTWDDARVMLANLVGLGEGSGGYALDTTGTAVLALAVGGVALAWLREQHRWDWQRPLWARYAVLTTCLAGIVIWAPRVSAPFVYFQF